MASSPARRRRRKGSNATTPLTLSPVRGVRARASSSSSSSTTGEIGLDDMDCGASSVVSGSSVPPTVYSYGSGSSTTWSGSSTDSESDKGVITRPSKFTRTDVPLGACAVTLEGLRSNRLVQCRVVAVDVSTGTESEPGPIAVAYTDMSVPPAPSAPVCAVDLKSPGCIVLTWRVPEGSAKDDAASAPTAHQVQAAPALSRPFQTVSKRKGGDGKGGANKGSTKSGSNAVAGTGPRDASSPGELQWRVVYEGAESRVTLPEPELCGPGESIVFRCRAYNAAGAGAYGKLATHRRDAAAPSPPEPPTFTSVTPDGVKVRWRPPLRLNGSVVAAYRAQMQTVSRAASGGCRGGCRVNERRVDRNRRPRERQGEPQVRDTRARAETRDCVPVQNRRGPRRWNFPWRVRTMERGDHAEGTAGAPARPRRVRRLPRLRHRLVHRQLARIRRRRLAPTSRGVPTGSRGRR